MIVILFFVLVALSSFVFKKLEKSLFSNSKSLLALAKQAIIEKNNAANIQTTHKQEQENLEDSDPAILEKITLISRLETETKELNVEADRYNNPSEYAKHSKLRRKVIANERKIEDEKEILKKLRQEFEANRKDLKQEQLRTEVPNTSPRLSEASKVKSTSEKSERNLRLVFNIFRIAFPIILLLSFRRISYPIRMDASQLYPLDALIGKAIDPFVFHLSFSVGYLTICYCVLNRLKQII